MKYLFVFTLLLVGCTDANKATWDALGKGAHVSCYSGGKEVFAADTTGKVSVSEGGGYTFKTTEGVYVETFADCFATVQL